MKKYLNLIVGTTAAALTFVWFALNCYAGIGGYDLMSLCFKVGQFEYTLIGILTIALMVVAVAILVLALLKVLKVNINVNLAKLTRILLIVAAALAVLYLIMLLTKTGRGVTIGAGAILLVVTYVAAVVCNFVVKEK